MATLLDTKRLVEGYHPREVISLVDAVQSFSADYDSGFDWKEDKAARERALDLPIDNTLAPNNSGRHYWFDISTLYETLMSGEYQDAIDEVTVEGGPISGKVETLNSLGREIDASTYVESALGEN